MLTGSAGRYAFCQYCEQDSECTHEYAKLTQRTAYVLRYIYQHDSGIHHYPLAGSWEDQPQWFMSMYEAGACRMSQLRAEAMKKKAGK